MMQPSIILEVVSSIIATLLLETLSLLNAYLIYFLPIVDK